MRDKNKLIVIVLAVACVFLIIVVLSLSQHANSINKAFKKKQGELNSKLAEYKDRIESLQPLIDEKTAALTDAENQKEELKTQVALIEAEKKKIQADFEALQMKNTTLKKRIQKFENASLETIISEALEKEENSSVKRLMADSLAKVELIRSGKAVDLEPIVITKSAEEAGLAVSNASPSEEGKKFLVIALDAKNNLIAINGGRKDKLKENDRLVVLKNGRKIASASVIAVRYRVTSAFVDSMFGKYAVKDIKEGDEVTIAGE